jgi:hypothetical protein
MPTDWIDDDSLSKDETLARFQALNPQPAGAPPDQNTRQTGIRLLQDSTGSDTCSRNRAIPPSDAP